MAREIELINNIENEMVCANNCPEHNSNHYDIDRCRCYKKECIQQAGKMLDTLKRAYQKHQQGNEDIGWEELASELCDTLCNVMGNDEFCVFAKLTRADQIDASTDGQEG
jgi:hypothetical protein